MAKDWLGKVDKSIEKKGTEGVFSKEASKQKMSTLTYANKVIKDLKGKTKGDKLKLKKLRQAIFAKNAIGASKKK